MKEALPYPPITPITPIRSEADYDAAIREIKRLWDSVPGTPDADRLEVLAILAEDFQKRVHFIGPPSPISAIQFRMEAQGLTRRDMEQYLGPAGTVAAVLEKRRALTLPMMRKVSVGLSISMEILVQEYELT
jgi:HTH-type transcriptional regulator/antitoxin HigA